MKSSHGIGDGTYLKSNWTRRENGKIEGEPTFPYVDAQYIVCDYSPDMTVSKAYEWMKENIAEFKDAEDI